MADAELDCEVGVNVPSLRLRLSTTASLLSSRLQTRREVSRSRARAGVGGGGSGLHTILARDSESSISSKLGGRVSAYRLLGGLPLLRLGFLPSSNSDQVKVAAMSASDASSPIPIGAGVTDSEAVAEEDTGGFPPTTEDDAPLDCEEEPIVVPRLVFPELVRDRRWVERLAARRQRGRGAPLGRTRRRLMRGIRGVTYLPVHSVNTHAL